MKKKLFMMALFMVGHSGYAVEKVDSNPCSRKEIYNAWAGQFLKRAHQSGVIGDLESQVKYVAAYDLSADDVKPHLERLSANAELKIRNVLNKEFKTVEAEIKNNVNNEDLKTLVDITRATLKTYKNLFTSPEKMFEMYNNKRQECLNTQDMWVKQLMKSVEQEEDIVQLGPRVQIILEMNLSAEKTKRCLYKLIANAQSKLRDVLDKGYEKIKAEIKGSKKGGDFWDDENSKCIILSGAFRAALENCKKLYIKKDDLIKMHNEEQKDDSEQAPPLSKSQKKKRKKMKEPQERTWRCARKVDR